MTCSSLLAAVLLAGSSVPLDEKDAGGVVLDDGRFPVEINRSGVLIGAPENGLVASYGAAPLWLGGEVVEWRGVIYRAAGELRQAVLRGREPDWARRPEAQRVSFRATAEEALAVTRTDDFLFETSVRFDPTRAELISTWQIENVSNVTLSDVIFTHEWTVEGTVGNTWPPDLEGTLPPAPHHVVRSGWMADELVPGARTAFTYCYRYDEAGIHMVDVPLELYTDADWPSGLPIDETNGISWGDFDADGWSDFFTAQGRELWRNKRGNGWRRFRNVFGPDVLRYGSSFGDYNNDGWPDIGTEPRGNGNSGMNLLKNLATGKADFEEVADDPEIVDVRPEGAAETLCWADVDHDGNLDGFLPVYPPWAGGPGNFFLHNLGPVASGGRYAFHEASAEAGLDNPAGSARPEGAEFVDLDYDGDVEMYSNGTLYQNHSTPGTPFFLPMTEAASGIQFSTDYDEGCAFFDHDLDGDYDLLIAYCAGGHGVRLFEGYGDGMFDLKRKGIIESPDSGLCLGFSFGDWDNDGDIDFTTKEVFRRNMFVETGQRGFIVATHNIPAGHLTNATPAWADWDHDGDIDGLIGNWLSVGHFYDNVTYDESTPLNERRYVRVRVMRDSDTVAAGLETEYGANVQIFVEGEENEVFRRQVVTSAGGYLNQNEYVVHFALPADPFPDDDSRDLHFDVAVDFVSDPAVGFHRVDRQVNPELSNIDLAELIDREITVYRGGAVVKNDCRFEPALGNEGTAVTTTGGLATPTDTVPLPDPSDAPDDWYVGLDFDTTLATGPLQLKEVIVDGALTGSTVDCGDGPQKIALWDVTDPNNPVRVPGANITASKKPRNRRNYFRASAELLPGKSYRLVARVSELRASPITGPVVDGPITVHGGLSFQDLTPCTGVEVVNAVVDPANVYVAARITADSGELWTDLGYALDGTNGTPSLQGSGALEDGETVSLQFSGGPANTPTLLFLGLSPACIDAVGGTLLPAPDFAFFPITDGSGSWTMSGPWTEGLLGGGHLYAQVFFLDAAGPKGWAASNAVSATEPY